MPTPPPELRPPFTPPTEAERAALVQSVEPMVRKQVRDAGVRKADRDDAVQECMIELWKASAGFDPTGPAKFSTWGMYVIRKAIARFFQAADRSMGCVSATPLDECMALTADPRTVDPRGDDAADELSPADADLVNSLDREFRRGQLAAVLDALTDTQRKLVEMIAVDGLTAYQAGGLLGWEQKVVMVNVRAAVLRLWRAGKVPPAMARACGIDPAALDFKADPEAQAAHRDARRALIREALALGWTSVRIADELGEDPHTVGRECVAIRSGKWVPRRPGRLRGRRCDPTLEARRGLVKEMLDRGHGPTAIAAALGETVPAVTHDIRCIRAAAVAAPAPA